MNRLSIHYRNLMGNPLFSPTMKPKDLIYPYSFEKRKPYFNDQVLFVPTYYFDHESHGIEDYLPRGNPIYVEFCSGNGEWILERAIANPEITWVAVEKKFQRVRQLWAKMKNRCLKNLIIVCGEAEPFTKYYLPESSISRAFINFPDPWPKDRHAKHRLIQAPFVADLEKIMSADAIITIVTDDTPYMEQVIEVFSNDPFFQSLYPEPYYITDVPEYGSSFFNRLWLKLGRKIHFIEYQKIVKEALCLS